MCTVNVQSVRIVDIRQTDESENTVNYNEDTNDGGGAQGTSLISGKWYTGECLADGASPRATIEWSIDGNGTLADEIPSSPIATRITVIEVSVTSYCILQYGRQHFNSFRLDEVYICF